MIITSHSLVPFTVHTVVFTVFLRYKYFLLTTTHSLVLFTVRTLVFTAHYNVNTVQVIFNDYYATVGTFIFPIQHLGLGRDVALMAAFLLSVTTLMKN